MRIATVMMTALIVLMTYTVPTAYAYTWYSEDNGEASLTIEWGGPYKAIAEYSPHTLKLGERCITYASATAKGSMYVYGWAVATGWVTGTIYWYQRGNLAGDGIGAFNRFIRIKFQAIDITTGALVEKVALEKHGIWSDEGTWRSDSMDIWLEEAHRYKFILYVEVHADAFGVGSAIADFGGIWWSDSRIEWGHIRVPYVELNLPPLTPSKPSGSTSGYRNVGYTYLTNTTDPDEDDVRYEFEFSGPIPTVSFTTGWYASGETGSLTVFWETTDPLGTYYVRARAQDVNEEWSYWSASLTVTIVNRAPNTPSKPSGPTSGYTDGAYTYSTGTTDPDGDNIRYQFDWGDGSTTMTGYGTSGFTGSASHAWVSSGTYYVNVRALDVYGEWSNWSPTIAVAITTDGGDGGGGGGGQAGSGGNNPWDSSPQ